MFVDKLKDEECLEIMKKTMAVHYNSAFAQFITQESELIRENGVARLSFPVINMSNGPRNNNHVEPREDRCNIEDYEARVYVTGKQSVCTDKSNTVYRTMMYEKFGNEYYNALSDYLKNNARKVYEKAMANAVTELITISGGKTLEEMEK